MSNPRPSQTAPLTAGDICAVLHRRYDRTSQGRPGERYVCIEEARAGAGFDGNQGRCDFLAINTWRSRDLAIPGRGAIPELIGHEIKVTVSDWHAELTHAEKAERFARYCRRWFLVVPATLAARIVREVPPACGLMIAHANGRLTTVRTGEARDPEPVPAWWWVGWLAQIDRQHKRHLPALIEAAHAEHEAAQTRASLQDQVQRTLFTAGGAETRNHEVLAGRSAAPTGAPPPEIGSPADLGLEGRL